MASLQIQNVAMTANLAQVQHNNSNCRKPHSNWKKSLLRRWIALPNKDGNFARSPCSVQNWPDRVVPGVTTETVAPSTSGNPTTRTCRVMSARKVGGGKVRLPVVQPVVDPTAPKRDAATVVGGNNPGTDSILRALPTVESIRRNPKSAFPGINQGRRHPLAKSPRNTDTDLPTDRNPHKLGKTFRPDQRPAESAVVSSEVVLIQE